MDNRRKGGIWDVCPQGRGVCGVGISDIRAKNWGREFWLARKWAVEKRV